MRHILTQSIKSKLELLFTTKLYGCKQGMEKATSLVSLETLIVQSEIAKKKLELCGSFKVNCASLNLTSR